MKRQLVFNNLYFSDKFTHKFQGGHWKQLQNDHRLHRRHSPPGPPSSSVSASGVPVVLCLRLPSPRRGPTRLVLPRTSEAQDLSAPVSCLAPTGRSVRCEGDPPRQDPNHGTRVGLRDRPGLVRTLGPDPNRHGGSGGAQQTTPTAELRPLERSPGRGSLTPLPWDLRLGQTLCLRPARPPSAVRTTHPPGPVHLTPSPDLGL